MADDEFRRMSDEYHFRPLLAPYFGWLQEVQRDVAGCKNDLAFLSKAMSRVAASSTQMPAVKESALGFAKELVALYAVARVASAAAYKFIETRNGCPPTAEPTEATRASVAALPRPDDVPRLWVCTRDALGAMQNRILPAALVRLSVIEEEAGPSPVVENGTLGKYKESVEHILTEMRQLFPDLEQDG